MEILLLILIENKRMVVVMYNNLISNATKDIQMYQYLLVV